MQFSFSFIILSLALVSGVVADCKPPACASGLVCCQRTVSGNIVRQCLTSGVCSSRGGISV
ncbi:hypothetical protein BDV98DRAFT_218754 [Pterulicium gracile]|uniref:Hydrophobin n=1 Tax=Pterulicium gracile TaxID=1884261 RepID=A0A5C3QAK4_9AGAR|nr:hypothetical protein BDV98DRAFT_218754 [Pterula gracilis]